MKLKLKHLRHPLQAAALARRAASLYLDIKKFGDRSSRRYRDDPRFNLENVSRGFVDRAGHVAEDTCLLERICAAYNRAIDAEKTASAAWLPTEWWRQVRETNLGPVRQALRDGDTEALGRMYRNFFRNPCSSGLIGLPYGQSKAYFGRRIRNLHRRCYLGDALYRLDHWTAITGGCFSVRDLAGPEIGNPFGVVLEETLVPTGAPYHHYAALRVSSFLDPHGGTVAEIGGGYGAMAYYLLRDTPGLRYLNFDVPESIALASYYLMKAFPHLVFLLYGEKVIGRADVVLMPLSELEKMPHQSADITFSSHALSDVSEKAVNRYLEVIAYFTRNYLLYIGDRRGAEALTNATAGKDSLLELAETRSSGWHIHTGSGAEEVECLYRLPVPALAAQQPSSSGLRRLGTV